MPNYFSKQAVMKPYAADELVSRGWTLYGYDPHAESFDAVWSGLGERDGWLVGVWLSDSDVEWHSGQDEMRWVSTRGGTCDHCAGTGEWPGGLTYQEALLHPEK